MEESKLKPGTLDYSILSSHINYRNKLPIIDLLPIEIAELPLRAPVPHDGIDHAYHVATVAEMHDRLRRLGGQKYLIRCTLSRSDWDVIHNFIANNLNLVQAGSQLDHALMRLLVKVHGERAWLNTMSTPKIYVKQSDGAQH